MLKSENPGISIKIPKNHVTIGVTCRGNKKNIFLPRAYIKALRSAGGTPLLLPDTEDESEISDYIRCIDGLLLAGGGDIHPQLYGQTKGKKLKTINLSRDRFECKLLFQFKETEKPLLGICRGIQVMNVAFGGDLYQDLERVAGINHWQKRAIHTSSHEIIIKKNTLLHSILNVDRLEVNSRHHQAVRKLSPWFTASALAPDSIIEAIEARDHPFFLGVQFHPEYLYKKKSFRNLFQNFVEACAR